MMNEIWKDIIGYEGLYQISNLGRVKSLGNSKSRKEKILKLTKKRVKKSTYYTVNLHKNGVVENFRVNRLVAQAFIPNPYNLSDVNHIDEDTLNNVVSNLEWLSHKDNCNYGTRNTRMSESNTNNPKRSKQIVCIETGIIYPSIHEASRKLNINYGNLCRALKHKEKTCGGYHWNYIESTLAI